jgi:hypothetical protein
MGVAALTSVFGHGFMFFFCVARLGFTTLHNSFDYRFVIATNIVYLEDETCMLPFQLAF